MPGHPDDPYVVAEVLAAELRPDAQLLRQFVDFRFQHPVAEGVARGIAGLGQTVEPLCAAELDRLQVRFCAGAADDNGQMIGRAGRGTECLDLFLDEGKQLRLVQHGPGLLVQERLVGRPAAFQDEHQVELFRMMLTRGSHDAELHWHIVARVHLIKHADRCHHGVAQVGLRVSAGDAVAQRLLLVAFHPDPLTLLSENDGGASVLTHRQHTARGNICILQQVERHEAIVGAGFGIIQNVGQLPEMGGTQEVGNLVASRPRQLFQRVRLHLQHGFARNLDRRNARYVQTPVGRRIYRQREHGAEGETGWAGRIVERHDGLGQMSS